MTALEAEGAVRLMRPGVWSVHRFSDVNNLLRDPRLSVEAMLARSNLGGGPCEDLMRQWMMEKDGEEHRRIRSAVSRAFTPKSVVSWRPLIERVATSAVDALVSAGGGDLIREFAIEVPMQVGRELVGIDSIPAEQVLRWVRSFVVVFDPLRTEAQLAEADAVAIELAEVLAKVVAQRRSAPQDDMISLLVNAASADGRLTDQEVVANSVLFVFATLQDLSGLLGTACLHLLSNPDRIPLLVQDPDRAVAELARFDPPTTFLPRVAVVDVVIDGVTIPAGDLLLLSLRDAGQDCARFEQPLVLDLERPARHAIAWGAGPHHCIGASLSRLEACIALSELFTSGTWRLDLTVEDIEWERYGRCPAYLPVTRISDSQAARESRNETT